MSAPGAGSTCTIQLHTGRFCDGPADPRIEYPVCSKHARNIFEDVLASRGAANPLAGITAALGYRAAPRDGRHSGGEDVVYYFLIDGLVKIGTTRNLPKRTQDYPPTAQLLATEPGGRDVEAQRLETFREYHTARREWFDPGPRLRAHIEALPSYSAAA